MTASWKSWRKTSWGTSRCSAKSSNTISWKLRNKRKECKNWTKKWLKRRQSYRTLSSIVLECAKNWKFTMRWESQVTRKMCARANSWTHFLLFRMAVNLSRLGPRRCPIQRRKFSRAAHGWLSEILARAPPSSENPSQKALWILYVVVKRASIRKVWATLGRLSAIMRIMTWIGWRSLSSGPFSRWLRLLPRSACHPTVNSSGSIRRRVGQRCASSLRQPINSQSPRTSPRMQKWRKVDCLRRNESA